MPPRIKENDMARWKYQDLEHLDFKQIEQILRPGDEIDEKLAGMLTGWRYSVNIGELTGIIRSDRGDADYIGSEKLHYTMFRDDDYKPFVYCGLCANNGKVNLHPRTARRVFIISAFHAENEEDSRFNKKFNEAVARREFLRGNIPVMPHLYFTRFLKDEGFERAQGIEAGHLWMDHCNHVKCYVVDGKISKGMDEDLKYAALKGFAPEMILWSREKAETEMARLES